MTQDQYPSIFKWRLLCLLRLQIFLARAVLKIGNITRIFRSFSWDIFGQVARYTNRARAKIFHGF